MSGEQIMNAADAYGQMVSGMTAAEAINALQAVGYATNGASNVLSFPMQAASGGGVYYDEAYAAAQAWEQWKALAGAGVTALGAAAAGAKAWASGVLFGDSALANTLVGSGGLLTMSLPAAAAALAPCLGVSIGSMLYSSNPELWTKISQTLLPWCYEGTQTIGAAVDENGQVYLPKDALEALKQLFEAEGIGGSGTASYTSDLLTDPVYAAPKEDWSFLISNGQVKTLGPIVPSGNVAVYRDGASDQIYHAVSASVTKPDSSWSTYRTGGQTVYYKNTQGSFPPPTGNPYDIISISPVDTLPPDGSVWSDTLAAKIAWTMIYGQYIPPGDFPDGTEKWGGVEIDVPAEPVIWIVTDPGEAIPYFPIQVPGGNPYESPDPEDQPDPTAPSSPEIFEPYVPPETDPGQWPEQPPEADPPPEEKRAPQTEDDPLYIPDPPIDPDIDPSAPPNPEGDPDPDPDAPPEPPPDPPIDPPPESTGTTPPIIFPPVTYPSIVPSSGSGLIHVYNPTPAEFVSFGHWLWVTYADATIDKIWNNPFDGIIGAYELYATPSQDGTDTIKSGFLDSGISSTIVRVRYTTINCGSIVIPEYYGNYLDYAPYSRAYVYLPFIGIVELEADDIVGHAVNVTYHIDSYNGSCIAQITVARDNYENTIYQFSGNCAVEVPLAGGSQAAIRAGMMTAAAYGIGSVVNGVLNGATYGGLAGAVVGGVTGGVNAAANAVAAAVSQKSSVQHSGSFGASYGAMGIKKPYLIIRRPIQKQVTNYQDDYGFPAYKRVILGNCTGYLRVREVNVISVQATDEEKALIESLLKTGVYVTDEYS